jgi:hypothetical protein
MSQSGSLQVVVTNVPGYNLPKDGELTLKEKLKAYSETFSKHPINSSKITFLHYCSTYHLGLLVL